MLKSSAPFPATQTRIVVPVGVEQIHLGCEGRVVFRLQQSILSGLSAALYPSACGRGCGLGPWGVDARSEAAWFRCCRRSWCSLFESGPRAYGQLLRKWCAVLYGADHDSGSALTLLIPARLAREPPAPLNLGGADETRSLLKTFAASSWACLRSRPVDCKESIVRFVTQGLCCVRQRRTFGYDLLKVSRNLLFFRHCAGIVTYQ